MGNRVLEIVVFLMSHIKDHQGQLENIDDISSYLKSNGFTDNEISSAYSWVLDQLQTDSQFIIDGSQSNLSTRVLTEQERRYFTRESCGYVLQLKYLGLISDSQLEMILERGALLGPSPVNLEEVKMLVGSMLFRENELLESGRHQMVLLPDDEGLIN
nr:DUF494 family protein [candidate division Zixibacteria bacterium]